ncbi:MAG TPA: hypothetical protein VM428_11820 [Microlunatus sp.]|nr:hypothetical protein [Microlunatus sp.]
MATFRTNDGATLSYADKSPTGREAGSRRDVVRIHGYTAPAAARALELLLHGTEPSA